MSSRFARLISFFVLLVAVTKAVPSLSAQSPPWFSDLNQMLNEFMSCQDKADDLSPCNRFVGKALARVYKVNDFGPDAQGQFLTANAIAAYVATSTNWVFMGEANKQSTLDSAKQYAEDGRAILAVKADDPSGHVALILPGPLSASANWNGLNCPNSASFLIHHPEKSYVAKKLSFGFELPSGVKIYGRETSR